MPQPTIYYSFEIDRHGDNLSPEAIATIKTKGFTVKKEIELSEQRMKEIKKLNKWKRKMRSMK